jgi:hypothetical protein
MERMEEKPKIGWMLDVDGVITDPVVKIITDKRIIEKLAEKLAKGEPVGLNTGRSLEFVKERVLKPIEEQMTDRKLLDGLYVAGEKGGTWGKYNEKGIWEEYMDMNFAGIPGIQKEAERIAGENPDKIMLDMTKKTITTLEMPDGGNLEEFKVFQKSAAERLRQWLAGNHAENEYLVDETRIAIDVEKKNLGGKNGAAKLLLSLMVKDGRKPDKFVVLGDSLSDGDMQKGLREMGADAEFVFVGEGENAYPIGTLMALQIY